jgi:hypothetical protein
MKNILWYIILAIIGIAASAYALYKRRGTYKISAVFVFYLFAACLAWTGEFLVLGLFNAYRYKTGIVQDMWAQNLLGHLILNTTLYPASAIIMVVYSFRFGWMTFVAVFLTAVETLCLKYGVYEHNWWRTYMTAITVYGLLYFENKWYAKIKNGCSGFTRAFTYYFVAMIIAHLPAPILLLLGKQYYHMDFVYNLVPNLFKVSILIVFFYHLIESFVFVIFTCVLKKWYWKIAPFIVNITCQFIFVKMGILNFWNGWNLIYTLIIYEIFIAIYIWVEKKTLIEHKYF